MNVTDLTTNIATGPDHKARAGPDGVHLAVLISEGVRDIWHEYGFLELRNMRGRTESIGPEGASLDQPRTSW